MDPVFHVAYCFLIIFLFLVSIGVQAKKYQAVSDCENLHNARVDYIDRLDGVKKQNPECFEMAAELEQYGLWEDLDVERLAEHGRNFDGAAAY